jgi:hypothetical protein
VGFFPGPLRTKGAASPALFVLWIFFSEPPDLTPPLGLQVLKPLISLERGHHTFHIRLGPPGIDDALIWGDSEVAKSATRKFWLARMEEQPLRLNPARGAFKQKKAKWQNLPGEHDRSIDPS